MDPCAPQPKSIADYASIGIMLAACVGAGWLMHLATRSELAAALTMVAFLAAYLWPRQSPECRAYLAAKRAADARRVADLPAWLISLDQAAPSIPSRVPT